MFEWIRGCCLFLFVFCFCFGVCVCVCARARARVCARVVVVVVVSRGVVHVTGDVSVSVVFRCIWSVVVVFCTSYEPSSSYHNIENIY